MSDDRFRPVLVPTSQAAPDQPDQPEPPVGRCLKCGAVLTALQAYPSAQTDQSPRSMHVKDGAECGPVAKAIFFHVIAFCGPMIMRRKMRTLLTPTEDYEAVMKVWEKELADQVTATDAKKGTVLVGAAKPNAVVFSWAALEEAELL